MIPSEHVIGLSALLFGVGAIGALTRRNVIVVLMSIELMLSAVNLALIAFDRVWAAPFGPQRAPGYEQAGSAVLDGQVFALLVIGVAAAEVAVGLAILASLVRNRDSLDVEDARLLRW